MMKATRDQIDLDQRASPREPDGQLAPTEVIFKGKAIRSVMLNGVPWFVVKDACAALELADTTTAVRGLDDEEKGKALLPTSSGEQEMNVTNESGLYLLAFNSKKPEAVTFRKWVTSEVLPSLRKGASGEAQDTGAGKAYVRLPGPGQFRVRLEMDGHLSIAADESRINDYYLMELEALAHASCLVGNIWRKFELLDSVSSHTGDGSNTRFQLGEAIRQAHHIAESAVRTRMEMLGGLDAPTV